MKTAGVFKRGWIAAVCGLVLTSACVLAAAGAGAGAGIYYTSRGVESVAAASIETTFAAAERTFRHFEIEQTATKSEDGGAVRELEGKSAVRDLVVKVKLEQQGDATRIEVSARESLVEWNKDFAREIVQKIVELAG